MGIWTQIMSKLLSEDQDHLSLERAWQEEGIEENWYPAQLYYCFSKDAQQQLASDPESYIAMLDRSIALAEACSSYDVMGEWTESNGQFS